MAHVGLSQKNRVLLNLMFVILSPFNLPFGGYPALRETNLYSDFFVGWIGKPDPGFYQHVAKMW